MADTLEADIIRVLTQTRDKIRARMEAEKVNASGRTSASLRVEPYDGGVRLVGGYNTNHDIDAGTHGTITAADTAPIPTLEFGRGSGKVPKGFYYIIREWAKDKGIQFANDTERGTFAYFIARKIAKSGTKRFTNHIDIYSTPVNEAKKEIEKLCMESVSRTVRAALGGASVQTIKGAFM